jgi:predicted PurR-regulated permease PerM
MNFVIGLILVAVIVGFALNYLIHRFQDKKRTRERARAAILTYIPQVDRE